jgi:hypothetical protein
MSQGLPTLPSIIKWYHFLAAKPIQLLDALKIGPFGGGYSVSPIIEGSIQYKRGEPITVPMSKTESFMFERMKDQTGVEQLLGYRRTQDEIQQEVLKHYSDDKKGVVWIGAGIVSTKYPLIAERKPEDLHVWTDKRLSIVQAARPLFAEMQDRMGNVELFYDLVLPEHIDKLNRIIKIFANAKCNHVILSLLGVWYILTPKQHQKWLTQLEIPDGMRLSFILSGMGMQLPLVGKIAAAIDNQRSYEYNVPDIKAVLDPIFPAGKLMHTIPREEDMVFETWWYRVPPRIASSPN